MLKTVPTGTDENDRCFAVDTQRPDLATYVKRIRTEKRLSLKAVERQSGRRGNKIASSYVSRIENGVADPTGITPKKLEALALGLDVPEADIFAIARGQVPPIDENSLEEKAVRLPRRVWSRIALDAAANRRSTDGQLETLLTKHYRLDALNERLETLERLGADVSPEAAQAIQREISQVTALIDAVADLERNVLARIEECFRRIADSQESV